MTSLLPIEGWGGGGVSPFKPYIILININMDFSVYICTVCVGERYSSRVLCPARECSLLLHRNAKLAFPRSCTKFAFPRARVPKMPGTRERETKNARPSLFTDASQHSTHYYALIHRVKSIIYRYIYIHLKLHLSVCLVSSVSV